MTTLGTPDLKLKQASAVLDARPKDLQNFVQFRVVRPRKRQGLYWFDANALLEAKVAFYLKETLGASTEYLGRFVRLVGKTPRFGTGARAAVIRSRPSKGRPAIEVRVPLRALERELRARLRVVDLHRDLPRGRKRAGWRDDLLKSLETAAGQLGDVSDAAVVTSVREHRRSRRARRELSIASAP
jgi:hypothetical protein